MKVSNRYRVPLLAALLVIPTAMFGFAAANSVPLSAGGEAAGAISGYQTTNVHYTLNAANPEIVDNVQFVLTPSIDGAPNPTTVKGKVKTSQTYASAELVSTNGTQTSWIFTPTASTLISETDFLSVIATQ